MKYILLFAVIILFTACDWGFSHNRTKKCGKLSNFQSEEITPGLVKAFFYYEEHASVQVNIPKAQWDSLKNSFDSKGEIKNVCGMVNMEYINLRDTMFIVPR